MGVGEAECNSLDPSVILSSINKPAWQINLALPFCTHPGLQNIDIAIGNP